MSAARPSLDVLFRPAAVAILGASDNPDRISGRPLRYLREGGFAGAIYPVNPNRSMVQGLPSYPSVAALPTAPDVALLAVPAEATEQAVRDCVARGVKAAVIFSAGYAESDAGGTALQDRIAAIAAAGGMRLLGPNCLGACNARIGFFATFTQSFDRGVPGPGPVAIVSQSGAYGSHLAYLVRQRGLGASYWITTGNEADIDVPEALEWMVRQDEVGVILAYVEGVRDGARLVAALRAARAARKPVVMMKVGRSAVGALAAQSHTASLAGADEVYDAVFRQFGVHRATTTEEQVDIAYACARGLYPRSPRLALVTLSGGVGVQMSDAADRHGLEVTAMPAASQAELKALLPYAAVGNPVDTTAQALNDMGLMARNLEVILEAGIYDALIGFFSTVPATRTLSGPLRDAITQATARFPDRLMVLSMAADREVVRSYEERGFLVFEDVDRAVAAVAALHRFAVAFERDAPAAGAAAASLPLGAAALSEYAAKRLLAAAGVSVPVETLAHSAAEAVAAAAAIDGPVAMKLVSAAIAHKTEIGGVILGVVGADAVRAAYATLLARAAQHRPDAALDGVLVTPMADKGVEVIVGVTRDPVFGPVLMFGLGGIFVEVFKDVTFRLAPVDLAEAQRMIGEVRGRAMLAGARGAPPADVDALAAALVRISQIAHRHRDHLESLEINPLLVLPQGRGVLVLDALVQPRQAVALAAPPPSN